MSLQICDDLHVFNYKCLLLCIVSYKHFMDYIMLPITQGDSMDWSVPEHVSIVCSLFAEQVQKGNRPNTHLNAVGYAKVSSRFFQITGIELSKTQLKNKWEKLKCDLTAWRKLMRRQTGTGWDHLR
jgi:predicted nucleic acid-binding Zn finger protein